MSTVAGWAVGQRVRNEAEPSLGLGIVLGFPTPRSVEIMFPGAGETRVYNPVTAPLRRYELGVGQTAETRDGRRFRVERVEADAAGLLTYHGEGQRAPEGQLADTSASNDPLQRLMAGELSDPAAFDLRARGWATRAHVLSQRSRGLTGARVALMPHQLAIAHRIASRERPRVLLADEVGLGKTIEACLIFSALRALGRADRVLVLAPPSLVHQWLIELYRRFNELFTLVQADARDPFDGATRFIAPIDSPRLAAALDLPWDLVIVDEAHHLAMGSPGYGLVEGLAAKSPGLLLLTATPLRQGLETEFGLLRLVDPDRFPVLARFEAEHAHMRGVAAIAARVAAGEDVRAELRALYPESAWDGPPDAQLAELIDRHGTGRVLVRNRREKLGGFPGRALLLDTLPDEAARGAWALDLVRGLEGKKAVVMASSVEAVKKLERLFKTQASLQVAVFHEQLGLVERDRQAAYFAAPDGAEVLISSEIGGEGRNFQFCHHLILFDLPLHPDALEQRIGRLDRIGQTETIRVHVGVVEGGPDAALFAWHRALGVFDAPFTGGEAMLEAQEADLRRVMAGEAPLDAFLAETARLRARHLAEVQASVDLLVDLNSFDQPLGEALADEVRALDRKLLAGTVSGILEHFGVVEDDMADPKLRLIRPGATMRLEAFPGLRDDGYLATYDRAKALAREDVQFLSPDHPLVEGGLALLLDQAEGRASLARLPDAGEQGVLVEFLFLLEAVGPPRLALQRFLPPVALEVALDMEARPQPPAPDRLQALGPAMWTRLAGLLNPELPGLLDAAQAAADARLRPLVDAARARAEAVLGGEQRRLRALQALGNVPAAEVEAHAAMVADALRHLAAARVSLDAVRVVLLDPG